VTTTGDIYERELKHLLEGDDKAIEKMLKTCSDLERSGYNQVIDNPFMMIRAAGSLGVDLVALRWDFSFPIEVKSSASDIFHFSRSVRLTEQAEDMRAYCERTHLVPVYAFRLKGVRGDPWRIFTLPVDGRLRGNCQRLKMKIPEVEITNGGKYIMRWGDGMKLSEFIQYMSFSDFEV